MSSIQEALKKAQGTPVKTDKYKTSPEKIRSSSSAVTEPKTRANRFTIPGMAVFVIFVCAWVILLNWTISGKFTPRFGPRIYTKNSRPGFSFKDIFKERGKTPPSSSVQAAISPEQAGDYLDMPDDRTDNHTDSLAETYTRSDILPQKTIETPAEKNKQEPVQTAIPALNGIMFAGSKPLAIIGDDVLGEGDEISDIKVVKIYAKRVDIEKNGEKLTLTLNK